MSTPMEVDTDALPAQAPEEQEDPQPEPHQDTTTEFTTSKKKAPKKPSRSNAEAGKGAHPAERVPGTTTLPVARVKRILGADEDLQNIGREALFLLSVATEHFLKRMADSGYLKARMDGRKTITLRDMANAVKQNPEMEFLTDIVPSAVPLSVALAARKKNAQDSQVLPKLDAQPLSSLIPQVPMLPSRNSDYPDALMRRQKDMTKAKASARKSAAGAAGGAGDGEPDGEEAPVAKKAAKAKPKARKSAVPVEGGAGSGVDSTRSDVLPGSLSGGTLTLLGRPQPTKKTVAKARDPPTPSGGQGGVQGGAEAMDDDW